MKYFKTECKNLFLSPKRLFYVLVFPLVIFGFFAAIFYKETLQLPFSVFSNSETITPDTIAFIEEILTSADKLVAKALCYFQEQLLIDSEGFPLSEEEKQLLSVPLQEIPFESPQFLFYGNKEWILHFAGGGFSFCEPYGVSFHFKGEEPILIENLEDAEEI